MKRLLLILLFIVFVAQPCLSAIDPSIDTKKTWKNAYRFTGKSKDKYLDWCVAIEDAIDGTTGVAFMYFIPGTEPADTKGFMYYDLSSNTIKVRTGSGYVALATASGNSLDLAYDAGHAITVDGTAVTLTTGAADDNIVLVIAQNETSNNNDAVTIANAGTGDAIQITPGATTGGGIYIIGKASGTEELITLDSTTNNMNLADNVGQLLINSDVAYAHKGAAGLVVYHQTGQPITAAEGFLARFVSSGTAQTNAYAVGITVPVGQPAMAINNQVVITGQDNSGLTTLNVVGNDTTQNTHALDVHNEGTAAAVLITPDDTDTPALLVTGKLNSTVTVVTIDGATADWIGGADNVAMVEITGGSTANADAGGGLLAVISDTNPASASEGFLARFIHTGTATTNAYAVEIETTNTTPCLQLNNQMTIAGSASGGIMLDITGADTSTDTVTFVGVGTGDVLQITANATTATGLKIIGAINGAAALAYIDGASVNWIGANDVGMLSLIGDTPATNAGSSLLFVQTAASPVAASEGFLVRLEQKTGAAVTDAYAMGISTTATTPCLHLNNELVITGAAAAGQLLTIVSQDADDITVSLTGVGSAAVLALVPNATAAIGLTCTAKASGTTADAEFDATAGWLGAADVGLVHIKGDSALTDNAASLFVVINATGRPKDGAQGFLARFVDSGTARTTAHAVEIKTTNTTKALLLNNQLTITGADSAGTLVAITGSDVTTDTDTIVVTHRGDASALKITTSEPVGTGIEIVCDAAQTSAALLIDATTGAWVGKAAEGILEIANDGTAADTTASMIYLAQSGTNISGQEGICLNMIDTSTSGGGTEYVMHIDSTNNEAIYVDSGSVLIDEFLTATKGLQVGVGETMTTAAAEGAGQQIDDDVTFANVTATTGVNEFITLPNDPAIGTVVYVMNNVGANFEIRTLAAGNDSINNVDTSDAATEYLCTSGGANNGDLVCFTYVTADRWIGVSYTYLGAVRAAVVPD